MNFPTDHPTLGALSVDAFLAGLVQIAKPFKGYRAGVDPVLRAASVPTKAADTVLELGCGVGVASHCLVRRIEGLSLTGVEVHSEYSNLAEQNAMHNDLEFSVHTADINALPAAVKAQKFNHVLANPPYYDPARSLPSLDLGVKPDWAGQRLCQNGSASPPSDLLRRVFCISFSARIVCQN